MHSLGNYYYTVSSPSHMTIKPVIPPRTKNLMYDRLMGEGR